MCFVSVLQYLKIGLLFVILKEHNTEISPICFSEKSNLIPRQFAIWQTFKHHFVEKHLSPMNILES